jgi:hypothetical protein
MASKYSSMEIKSISCINNIRSSFSNSPHNRTLKNGRILGSGVFNVIHAEAIQRG